MRKYTGWLTQYSPFHASKLLMERRALTESRDIRVIVNSLTVQKSLKDRYPEAAVNSTLILNAVANGFFCAPESIATADYGGGRVKLLFVGSGWDRKGLLLLLKELARINDERLELHIVGRDKNPRLYKNATEAFGLASKVFFRGVQPMSLAKYSEFHILIAPSLYDPFPNAVCEALCAGLPAIVSRQTGACEMVDNQSIFLFENFERSLLGALEYLSDSSMRQEKTEMYRHLFSQERLVRELNGLIS